MSEKKRASITVLDSDLDQQRQYLLSKLPKPIQIVREHSFKVLEDLLGTCFSRIDDVLFDLANKSTQSQDQDTYFFAMRELRVQRSDIEKLFFKTFNKNFAEINQHNSSSKSKSAFDALTVKDLSVVENEELDEIVAKEALIKRVNKDYAASLEAICQRFDAVVPADITLANLPVGPELICDAFLLANKDVDIEAKAKLVLFKLFEKHLLNALGPFYTSINTLLAERGILPGYEKIAQGASNQQNENASNPSQPTTNQPNLHHPVNPGPVPQPNLPVSPTAQVNNSAYSIGGNPQMPVSGQMYAPQQHTGEHVNPNANQDMGLMSPVVQSDAGGPASVDWSTVPQTASPRTNSNGLVNNGSQHGQGQAGFPHAPVNGVSAPAVNNGVSAQAPAQQGPVTGASYHHPGQPHYYAQQQYPQQQTVQQGQIPPLETNTGSASGNFESDIGGVGGSSANNIQQPMSVNSLVGLLNYAQQQVGPVVPKNASLLDYVTGLQAQSGVQGDVSKQDSQTLKLINVLFDVFKHDGNLASPIKDLLDRLQIPLAKVALTDRSFFQRPDHGARRFLNALADAGLRWNSNEASDFESDPIYKKMLEIIDTIVDDCDNNASIFDKLLTEFNEFNERENKRIAILEKRILAIEKGKAKAEKARLKVTDTIAAITEGRDVKGVVNTIIHKAWHQLLFVTALKNGTDSDQWDAAFSTLNALVWSTDNSSLELDANYFSRNAKEVVEQVKKGLKDINLNPCESDKLLKALEKLYEKMLAKIRTREKQENEAIQKQKDRQIEQEIEQNKSADSVREEDVRNTEHRADAKGPANAKGLAAEKSKLVAEEQNQSDSKSSETQSKLDRDFWAIQARKQALREAEAAAAERLLKEREAKAERIKNDPYLKQANKLTRGSWFDLNVSGSTIRCRLAAVIEQTSTYIFVNRAGAKAAEKNLEEVAEGLKSGTIKAVDSSQLFDRALEKVIVGLRDQQKSSQIAS